MRAIGKFLRSVRPGVDALASFRFESFLGNSLAVSSPAFKEGDAIPRDIHRGRRGPVPRGVVGRSVGGWSTAADRV